MVDLTDHGQLVAIANGQFRAVVSNGIVGPAGLRLGGVRGSASNARGDVIFWAVDEQSTFGVYRTDGSRIVRVVAVGDPTPDGQLIASVDQSSLLLGDAGDAAVVVGWNEGGGSWARELTQGLSQALANSITEAKGTMRLARVLAISIALALAACGGDDAGSSDVPFATLEQGLVSHFNRVRDPDALEGPTLFRFDDSESFAAFWRKHTGNRVDGPPLPVIDFSAETTATQRRAADRPARWATRGGGREPRPRSDVLEGPAGDAALPHSCTRHDEPGNRHGVGYRVDQLSAAVSAASHQSAVAAHRRLLWPSRWRLGG